MMKRTKEKVSFENGQGLMLAGILDTPTKTPMAYGVFAPCFTCVKESHGAVKICRALAERGIAILRFDHMGLGASEGDFAKAGFSSRIDDIIHASRFLTAQYQAPKILIGHSISGTAALSAVKDMPSIEVLATVGSPQDPASVIEKFRENNLITEHNDYVEINVMGRMTRFETSFVDDMFNQNIETDTAAITQKLRIFHAPNDRVVQFNRAQVIYDRAEKASGKKLIRLSDSATHLFEKGQTDADFIADEIVKSI